MLRSCLNEDGSFNNGEFENLVQKYRGKILGYCRFIYIPGGESCQQYYNYCSDPYDLLIENERVEKITSLLKHLLTPLEK